MVYFQSKNHNCGIFWKALYWKIWYILWTFGTLKVIGKLYGRLVYFVVILVYFYHFGMLWKIL
jgi:hypothetical protein